MIHLAGTLAILLAALTQPAPAEAAGSSTDAPAPEQGLVTREWSWADDGGVTVLTVQGPADQVAQFEPGDPPTQCPDGTMMSSVAFGQPEGTTLSIDPDQDR